MNNIEVDKEINLIDTISYLKTNIEKSGKIFAFPASRFQPCLHFADANFARLKPPVLLLGSTRIPI